MAVAHDQHSVADVVSEVGPAARVVTFAPGDTTALAVALARAVELSAGAGDTSTSARAATWDERAIAFSGVLVAAMADR